MSFEFWRLTKDGSVDDTSTVEDVYFLVSRVDQPKVRSGRWR